MKVILYMAMTANGIIARKNDDTSFVTDAEWSGFAGMIRKTGNLIIGRRTYDVMKKEKEFEKFGDVIVIVVGRSRVVLAAEKHKQAKSPQEALLMLQQAGCNEALVAGGGKLNGSFLKAHLIDEIFLDIEPLLLGKGIPLLGDIDTDVQLELIETAQLSKHEIQLHYKVRY